MGSQGVSEIRMGKIAHGGMNRALATSAFHRSCAFTAFEPDLI
jgi:hypothetical protein